MKTMMEMMKQTTEQTQTIRPSEPVTVTTL